MFSSQTHLARIVRTEMSSIKNFGDWCDAFAAFVGIFAKKAPRKIDDLTAYYLLISKAVKENPNSGWLRYDKLLRKTASNDSSPAWGIAEPSFWVTHLLGSSKILVRNFESQKPICQLFNQKRCFYTDCKYNQVCKFCYDFYHSAPSFKQKQKGTKDKEKRLFSKG